MVSLDEFSRLVAGVYGAALTPQTWMSTMNDIRSALGAHTASIMFGGATTRTPKVANASEEAQRAYVDYYHRLDYILEAVERGPVGQLSPIAPLRELNPMSEFNYDWMRPNHMDDGLFVRLTHGAVTASFLVASAETVEGFATPERIRLVNALVPHLQQALRTEDALRDAAADTRDVAAAVDSVQHGVVVVTADGEVVHMNSVAADMFAAADGLCLYKGRIETGRAFTSARLARSIGAATTGHSGVRGGDSMLCARPSGRRSYVLHVVPTEVVDPRRPRAMVLIVDPETQSEPPRQVLRRLFGLTAAEAEVAIGVLQGQGVKPIAEQLGVSQATVKTHLQKVFDKTDTHRQAELVRLLLRITPP